MNIFEVLGYGPIAAANEDYGLLITVNGSYLNLWVMRGKDKAGNQLYENTDCQSLSSSNGLYSITAAEMIEKAEEYLKETIEGDGDSDDEE